VSRFGGEKEAGVRGYRKFVGEGMGWKDIPSLIMGFFGVIIYVIRPFHPSPMPLKGERIFLFSSEHAKKD
jgi:hypothetical protein